MEFPETGQQCNLKECNLLDFLPIECAHCHYIFCSDHSFPTSHNCKEVKNNITEKKVSESFKCNFKDCTISDPLEMNCVVCSKHFCLQHRHHGCLDTEPGQSKREKQRACKEQFKLAKAETDIMVQDTLRNAKNRTLANKIKLMKIKGSAIGDNHVPVKDRVFFSVAPPLLGKESSKARAIFVSKTWSIGKCIDTFSKRLKVNNKNLEPEAPKLRLFSCEGTIITDNLNICMQNLLDSGTIIDGDSLILEYVNQEDIDNNKYDQLLDSSICSKYCYV